MGDCSNSRRRVTRFFRGRRPEGHGGAEDGFTLIEVVIAITLLVIVMVPFADAFITSLSATNEAHMKEVAAMVADSVIDQARAINATHYGGSNLVYGRYSGPVTTEWDNPPAGLSDSTGILADTTAASAGTTGSNTPTLPTTAQTDTVGGQTFTYYIYVGTCYEPSYTSTGSNTCNNTETGYQMYRVIVDVTWAAPSGGCGTSGCYYVASTLVSGTTDPAFDLNPVIPYITSANTATFTVGSAGTFQVTTSGFPPPTYTDASYGNGNCTASALPTGSPAVTLTTYGLLSGTPGGTPSAVGNYTVCINATNTDGTGTQMLTLTVAKAIPTITVAGPSAAGTVRTPISGSSLSATLSSGYNENATVTMGLYGPSSTPTCSGTPAWSGTATASGNTQVAAAASDTFTPTTSGDYWLAGSYPGDSNNSSAASTCGATEIVINKVTTSMSMTVHGGTTPYTVTSPTTATLAEVGLQSAATGSVTFTSGATTLCTATLPTTNCSTSTTLAGGSYTVTATYSGDSTYAGTTSTNTVTLIVDQAPTFTSGNSTSFAMASAGSFQATATGYPTSITFSDANFSGCTTSLPSGVTFANGLLSGTPASGTVGTYTVCITATNSGGSATQTFALTVTGLATSMSITVHGGTTPYTVTSPTTATLAEVGLQSAATGSVTFTSGATTLCTATLPTTDCSTSTTLAGGSYTVTATYSGDSTYAGTTSTNSVTLIVDQAPTFTSGTSTSFTIATAGTFQATATGYPTSITFSDANFSGCSTSLPSGVTFSNGLLSGTPASGTVGTYTVCITATNSTGSATQTFTLTVTGIATSMSITVHGGTAPYTVTSPTTATLAEVGLRSAATGSVTFTSGATTLCTATLPTTNCSTSTTLAGGSYTVTATYSGDSTYAGTTSTNTVTLIVDQAPTFTSGNSTSFATASAGSFQATATGYPTSITFSDANFRGCTTSLPSGVTFANGLLSGTPASGTVGTHTVCITATNSGGSATQTFALTVTGIATSMSITVHGGTTPYTVTSPTTATLAEVGLQSAATGSVTFTSGATTLCTATLPTTDCSTSTTLAGGSYTVTATYSGDSTYAGTTSTNSVTLIVDQAPTFTSGTSTSFTIATAGTFQATATGYPAITFSDANFSGCTTSLPSGVTFSNGLLSGTPASGTIGTHTVCITATNSRGSATQTFTLTVQATPSVSVAGALSTSGGAHITFTVTVQGVAGVTPTGSVAWSINAGAVTCTSTTSLTASNPALATCRVNEVSSSSTYTAIAAYSGDSNYVTMSATSAGVTG